MGKMIPTRIDGVDGETDEDLLDKREGVFENDNELTTWVEYRLKGQTDSEPVHRSAHVTIKPAGSAVAGTNVGSFG